MEGRLDFLFVDEAGQVPLANAVAMARCAKNLVLLGDQMQLEQPVQGSHPGDAGFSALQYALKDTALSEEDDPVFHAVVPADLGLFSPNRVECTRTSANSSRKAFTKVGLAHFPNVPNRKSRFQEMELFLSVGNRVSFLSESSTMVISNRATKR
jgi:hypothetical protein